MILKLAILRVLERMNGQPLTTQAVIDSVRIVHPEITESDVILALKRFENDRLIIGVHSEALETEVWTLDDKGRGILKRL